MPTPPRRTRFQIHLSTAVVLMFTAGGLIWANVQLRIVRDSYEGFYVAEGIPVPVYCKNLQYGWPYLAANNKVRYLYLEALPDTHYHSREVALNLLCAMAILSAVCFLCEWRIRWRAARKDT